MNPQSPPENSSPPAGALGRWQVRWFNFVLWAVIIAAFVAFLRSVEPILLPFVLGMMVAYLLDPFTNWLESRGLRRNSAASLVLLLLLSVLIGFFTWCTPLITRQVESLVAQAPAQIQSLEASLRDQSQPVLQRLNQLTGGDGPEAIPGDLGQLMQRGLHMLGDVASGLFSSGAALINVIALLLITPIVCFYFLRDWPRMLQQMDALLPRAYAPTIRQQLMLINRTLAGYVRGQVTVMLILSVFYVGLFALIGLKFSLALGALAGCIVIVPYIGSLISISFGLLAAHGQFGSGNLFWAVLATYAAGQILESQILTPKIIGDRVGLHPLWMLFGMLAGAALLGLTGVLIAVPLTAVIGVLVKFAVARYLDSGLYQG